MVELLPHEALSPFLWTGGVLGPHAVALPQQVGVGVGGHLAQRVRHRLRVFDMQVAPPENRLRVLSFVRLRSTGFWQTIRSDTSAENLLNTLGI